MPEKCCHRDHDSDGSCHIHSSPGVFRNVAMRESSGVVSSEPTFLERWTALVLGAIEVPTESSEPTFLESLGGRVRVRRGILGLTMEELASRMDMSKTGLWQIEKGRSMPGAGTLWRLSIQLRCSIDWIVTGKGE